MLFRICARHSSRVSLFCKGRDLVRGGMKVENRLGYEEDLLFVRGLST